MTRVILCVVACSVFAPALASAQTLADVARAEEARRKSVTAPAKVYTNGDLRAAPNVPAPPGPAPDAPATPGDEASGNKTPDAPAAAAPDKHDQAWWKERMTTAQTNLDRTKMFADALQSRINALNTDFVNRDDPAQRAVIEQDRTKALAELERVKKEIEQANKAIADIEDEARRAGVPPGWLR